MAHPPPLLVIVSGPPATGKTTLARRLASDLGLPLIAKDGFKETLFATLGWHDPAWSQRLGMASIALLYHVAEALLAAGHSFIAEANFDSRVATDDFRHLQERYPFEPFQIQCRTDGPTLLARFLERDRSPERHPGHVDAEPPPEQEAILLKGRYEPLDIGGTLVEVDTTDFDAVDYEGLRDAIAERLWPSPPTPSPEGEGSQADSFSENSSLPSRAERENAQAGSFSENSPLPRERGRG